MDSQPQYQVVRQELWWGSYLALGFKTVFALLKSLISRIFPHTILKI